MINNKYLGMWEIFLNGTRILKVTSVQRTTVVEFKSKNCHADREPHLENTLVTIKIFIPSANWFKTHNKKKIHLSDNSISGQPLLSTLSYRNN